MTKAHLTAVDEPIASGQDHEALCGATVNKAEFVMFVDVQMAGHCQVNSFHFCRKCWITPTYGKRYLYGLIDGQMAKQEEAIA
jgi:hypothetical protein